MSDISKEVKILESCQSAGNVKALFGYSKITGPGWWIAAASLSAGSLIGSVGLGQRLGLDGLWIQATAMLLGMFTLFAISQITLNTQQSLFVILKNDWNKSLATWLAVSAIITSFTWCMPQFRLGADAVVATLLPSLDNKGGRVLIAVVLLILSVGLSFIYEKHGPRSSIFTWTIKLLVLFVIFSAISSVILFLPSSGISLGSIFQSLVPSYSLLIEPSPLFSTLLENSGEMKMFWEEKILLKQKELALVCFSSTLGVNLMFALPLLLLNRNWRRSHDRFSKFNLFTTGFLPFSIVSVCLTLLSTIAFQHKNVIMPDVELLENAATVDLLNQRIVHEIGSERFKDMAPFQQDALLSALSNDEKRLASVIAGKSVKQWIASLSQTGGTYFPYLLGLTIFAITLSTIVILMIINGHLFCEVLGKPHKGPAFQSGSLLLAIASIGPFVWSDQDNWVSDPTYFISLAILPFALLSFALVLNNPSIMGRMRPNGMGGYFINAGIILSFVFLGSSSFYLVWNEYWDSFPIGQVLLSLIGVLLLIGHFSLRTKKLSKRLEGLEAKINHISKQSG
jgi:hypothetical protein